MNRYTTLKRGGFLKRKTPMKRISTRRRKQRSRYSRQEEACLIAHPFDQVWIAVHGLSEALVIEVDGFVTIEGRLMKCPRSDQVHHRNKCCHGRLTDERWWMATSRESHERIEHRKAWAREEGYLLPIQADADGKWGEGNQALTTPELLASKERKP